MPLNTSSLLPQRRRRIGVSPDVTESFGNAAVDVANPQATSGQRNDLGAFANPSFRSNALQQRASQMALDLGYDPQQEIAAAQTGINAQFDESQNKLARIFALDPGGTKSGTAQNRLETLETGRATTLSQTKQDILNRAGAEQRANVGTLDALLSSGSQRQIAGATTQSQLQNESLNRAIAQSGVTGQYTDPQTGQTYTPQAIKQYQDQLALQQSQVTGQYQGQQTEAARAARAQEALQGRQVTVSEAAQSTDASIRQEALRLQAEIQRGSLSIDQANQSLNDFIQRGQLAVSQRQITLAEGAQSDDVRIRNESLALQDRIQTGQLSVQQADQLLNDFIQREQIKLQDAQLFGSQVTGVTLEDFAYANGLGGRGRAEILRAAQDAGFTLDPATNKLVRQTLQSQAQTFAQAAQQAQLTGEFIDPKTGQKLDTLEKTQQAFTEKIQEAQLTGNLDDVATLAARSLALQEAELSGEIVTDEGVKKTIAQKALDLQGQIQKGQLALQQQAQAFGQNITEAELTGMYDRMGNETGAFQAAFNAKSGDANYNSRYDFDGNGVVDFKDWTEFAKISNNEPVQTLQGQIVQQQKAQNDFNQRVTEAGLTGTFAGQQTVQEAQRRFENAMTESQLFVDAPPITLNMNDYGKAFNARQGDANYRKELDIDNNGVINFTDFIELTGSGRVEILSGSMTDPFGSNLTFTYKPEGRMSTIAAQLGLDEKRLAEQTRQFNQTYEQSRNEFLTNTTGIVYDEDGNPTNLTTMQKQQYDEAKRQFNEQLETQVSQFAEQLGFRYDELQTRKDIAKDTAISQAILAGFGALGQLGSTALGAALGAGAAAAAGAGAGAAAGAGAGAAATGAGLAGFTAVAASAAALGIPFVLDAVIPEPSHEQRLGMTNAKIAEEITKKYGPQDPAKLAQFIQANQQNWDRTLRANPGAGIDLIVGSTVSNYTSKPLSTTGNVAGTGGTFIPDQPQPQPQGNKQFKIQNGRIIDNRPDSPTYNMDLGDASNSWLLNELKKLGQVQQ